jgi:hypothetical protein
MRKKKRAAIRELRIKIESLLERYFITTFEKRVASSSVIAIKPRLMKLSPLSYSRKTMCNI